MHGTHARCQLPLWTCAKGRASPLKAKLPNTYTNCLHGFELMCVTDLVQDGVVIFIVGVLVKVQLNDVSQLKGLARDRMLFELLDVGHNVCDVVHCAISSASLHTIHSTHKVCWLMSSDE